jgi:hypothetical protein
MKKPAMYDESLVPQYDLPDALIATDGNPVVTAAQWRGHRRGELLQLFADHVYGNMPGPFPDSQAQIFDEEHEALGGRAVRRQTRLCFGDGAGAPSMDVLLYLPRTAPSGAVPVFLGLNFFGNHTIHADPGIRLSAGWMRADPDYGIVDHRATEASRGSAAGRWPVEHILERGYGLATIYCGDLDPDFDDGYNNGVHPLFYRQGQHKPEPDEWGAIGAWAWGLSRGLDVLQRDAEVDSSRVAVMGHSRLGKTALWAGACDERFALVISNNSGCGGAALSRRRYGETVAVINDAFPHWFCDHHRAYNDLESQLPVDQHELIALAAPRPVYIASAMEDRWADPMGEFLAAVHAGPVYELLGSRGLVIGTLPVLGEALADTAVGYHVRAGGHGVTTWDWDQWLDFADRHQPS